jgi:hypothetical protein
MQLQQYFKDLVERWPSAFVSRTDAKTFSGGVLTSKSLANHDSAGTGPAERFRIGRKICYPTVALAEWMRSRAAECSQRTERCSPCRCGQQASTRGGALV